MIVKRDEFLTRYLIRLRNKLEKALPERGYESDMILEAMKVDYSTSAETLKVMEEENLE